MNLFKEIVNLNNKYNLIENNDIIVVGFSGGPDSVFLVEMLLKLKKYIDFKIYLVHINHMLRGKDADADEEFSCEYAKKKNLEIFHKKINISELAKEKKRTFEEVGREERYKFFKEVYNRVGGTKITTAHNKDDQIETFLFRIIRGTSLEGLEGIKLKKGNIIRPISEVYKEDILKYLNKNQIQYRIDKTNFENEYTRNSIRLDLIPMIEKRYNIRFKDKIYSLIEEIRENNKERKIEFNDFLIEDNKLKLKEILELSKYNLRKILNHYLVNAKIKTTRDKIIEIEKILEKSGTKEIDLNSTYKIIKDYDFLFIEEKKQKKLSDEKKFKIPAEFIFDNYKISAKKYETGIKIDKNSFLFELPSKESLENIEFKIRYRKAGDRISLKNNISINPDSTKIYGNELNTNINLNTVLSKKIKDIFINEKIPKNNRDKIPLLVYNGSIIWIIGIKKAYMGSNNQSSQKIVFSAEEVGSER